MPTDTPPATEAPADAKAAMGGGTVSPPLRRVAVDMALGRVPGDRLDRFLAESDPRAALREWFGDDAAASWGDPALALAIDRDIARLDALITDQLNAVIHHRRFLALEASWRGLRYLCSCAASASGVVVRAINASWAEIARDFSHATDFDRSALFHKVYTEEYGMPGGRPFGVLLCDYEIRHRLTPTHTVDDVAVLTGLAGVAAAAFAPTVLGASPELLGLEAFSELDRVRSVRQLFTGEEYRRYDRVRNLEDARFLGVVLPRVLMREPYSDADLRNMPFRYREDVDGLDASELCWGNAVYAFGEVLIRSYDLHGWFADICGSRRDEVDNGLVIGVPGPSVESDAPGVVRRFGCELAIPAHTEQDLSLLGLMNVNVCKDTSYLVFRTGASIQSVPRYDRPGAEVNARLSAMLRYILCVSRFAHYIKVQIRDRVGSFTTAEACESALQTWLHGYCLGNDDASMEMKARFPLREGRVEVRDIPGRPGAFACVLQLQPHFQLDQIFTTFKLVTDSALAAPQSAA
ncbi:type VI secretion system protein ImpD [Pseudoxanthobacter soli DSM 19599]|uniref:Type VI secretion system protein ImpD n=1 Tax=Pseudoxanthobacter soli DSM 19599 TaxID=1123029 RepID=A0A1M7ZQI8_9HYPH|nr:type VI secretion system protein ImpD [Pseudoxanthobacter soli DSM 19599]